MNMHIFKVVTNKLLLVTPMDADFSSVRSSYKFVS